MSTSLGLVQMQPTLPGLQNLFPVPLVLRIQNLHYGLQGFQSVHYGFNPYTQYYGK